jgi:hypothetical protein
MSDAKSHKGDKEEKAAVLVMKAATELRKAAALDKKRYAELSSVADYLESIIHETELGYGDPLFSDTAAEVRAATAEEEIKRMMKPFRVRLSR